MKNAKVIFSPAVDEAILRHAAYAAPEDVPAILDFTFELQKRLVRTLETAPLGGKKFQGNLRFFPMTGYVFLYEYIEATHEVHVVDMIGPGQNWR